MSMLRSIYYATLPYVDNWGDEHETDDVTLHIANSGQTDDLIHISLENAEHFVDCNIHIELVRSIARVLNDAIAHYDSRLRFDS
jgi:hypothetical protein